MLKDEASILAASPLFSGIANDTVLELFKNIPYSIKSYPKDALMMIRGERYDELKVLLNGEVSAEIHDFTGKVMKVENLKAPDSLAIGILFADDNTLPVTLVTQSEVKVISIPKSSIIQLAQNNQHFLQNFFTQSANKMTFVVEKLRLLKFSSLKQKLCSYVLSLAEKQQSQTILLPYNREQLAALFGVARPSLSRVCSEVVDQGLLSMQGKKVTVLDKEQIKALLKG